MTSLIGNKSKELSYSNVLANGFLSRPGGDSDAKTELVKFLTLAKEKGYEFRTVDTYLTD